MKKFHYLICYFFAQGTSLVSLVLPPWHACYHTVRYTKVLVGVASIVSLGGPFPEDAGNLTDGGCV